MCTVRRLTKGIVAAGLLAVLTIGTLGAPRRAEAQAAQLLPGTWVSSITVLNPSTNGTADVSVTFYDQSGNPVATVNNPSVAPGTTAFWYVPNVPGLPPGQIYSAVVSSNQQVYATVNLSSSNPTTAESYDGINGTGVGSTFYIASVLRNYYGFTSNIVVQNTSGSTANNVTVNLVGSGTSDSITLPPIPANASYTLDLGTRTELPNGFNGGATIQGNGASLAVITNAYVPTLTSQTPNYLFLSTNGAPAGAPQAYIPGLYKNYYGFVSALIVQDVDPLNAANVVVSYGNGATDSWTIPPGASHVFYTPNNPNLPNGWQGPATVTAVNGVNILTQVNIQATGQAGIGMAAYNGFTAGTNTVYAPGLLNNYYGSSSALTVQNVDTIPANVTLTYSNGKVETVMIPPGQSHLFYQPNEGLPQGFNGGATIVSSGGKIVGLINIQGSKTADQLYSTNAFGS